MVAALAAGCGGSSMGPMPTGPTIACPAAVTAVSNSGQPIGVSYAVPVAAGGSAPVAVTCTPASGSQFPVGSTLVICTATDARGRTG
ncbi:MAG: HYR domain-containing protein, partial [Vicinamibacterales bacterium]